MKNNAHFALGVDFGTLSARAVLIDTRDGKCAAEAVSSYEHGVMDTSLPDGTPLPRDYALQHPDDYLCSLRTTVSEVLRQARLSPEDIVGVGIDFTSCTVLPTRKDGTPLCRDERLAANRHAYVKLWKHHAAQPYAVKLTEIAEKRNESFLRRYSGIISSEWLFPKLWQVLDEDEEVYRQADVFVEAGDWVVWQLTGELHRSACAAGYKAMWSADEGYPDEEFFAALDPRLRTVVKDKLAGDVCPLGGKAGNVSREGAALSGLAEGTPVAFSVIDAHAAFPASGITKAGDMLMILGTSTAYLFLDEGFHVRKGICGIVKDGILPGFYAYEAGQACVGDIFDRYIKSAVPASYLAAAKDADKDIHTYLSEAAAKEEPGQSGLLALDWFGGCRTDLMDSDLTGMILGLSLQTRPEQIYRALIEATAFGARRVLDTCREAGIKIGTIYAGGGIALKNAFLMQIYADILGQPIHVLSSAQAGARGSAIYGAAAGGAFASVSEAAKVMSVGVGTVCTPIGRHIPVYDALYREYITLHDYFGEENPVMKRLKDAAQA